MKKSNSRTRKVAGKWKKVTENQKQCREGDKKVAGKLACQWKKVLVNENSCQKLEKHASKLEKVQVN